MTAKKNGKQPEWADSPAKIKALRTMDVTLPSGARVTLRTVTLDELAVADALPGDLLEAAYYAQNDLLLYKQLESVKQQRPEEARKFSESILAVAERITKYALVKPEPTDAVLAAFDQFDKRMILEIAQRKLTEDATGKVVAAQVLADFATFRDDELGVEGGGAGGAAEPDVAGVLG